MGGESFRQALSDFTFEAASGGAIRHLTDAGYTVKQIQERLDFPTPYQRIQEAVWKRLVDTGVLLLRDPRLREPGERVDYVREYDTYGRASFRRVVESGSQQEPEGSFLVCEFGRLRREDARRYGKVLEALDERQAEYIEGLPWIRQKVWHRADGRMQDIAKRLEAAGLSQDVCYSDPPFLHR